MKTPENVFLLACVGIGILIYTIYAGQIPTMDLSLFSWLKQEGEGMSNNSMTSSREIPQLQCKSDPGCLVGQKREGIATHRIVSSREIPQFKCNYFDCLVKEKAKLNELLKIGIVDFNESASDALWGHLLPWEKKLPDHYRPLVDHMDAGNCTMSTFSIVGRQKTYRKGDNVTVLMTIKDGHGRLTGHGGDQVRVWMVDNQHNASLATEVVDIGNGSYVAMLPLLWSGKVTLKASLAYNVATQRAHYYIRHIVKSTKYLAAGFTTQFTNEITLCSPFTPIPGYTEVCNFTMENGGMPWFCGMPKDPTIKCQHWTLNFDFDSVSPYPGLEADKHWWKGIHQSQHIAKRINLIGPNIDIVVHGRKKYNDHENKVPCENIPIQESWESKAPRGYFMNRSWIPTSCTLKTLNQDRINKCLENNTILMLGDSNMRLIFFDLLKRLGCTMKIGKLTPGHIPMVAVNSNKNIVLRFRTHALPFHMLTKDNTNRNNQKAVSQYIDEIPNEGRYWIIVHIYLHLTVHHDDLFKIHTRAVRASVEKLLKRNPDSKVIIRGPHACRGIFFTPKGGELVAPFYTEYIKTEFKGLQDRVFFLQPWDMTISMENWDIHPPGYISTAMVNVILGHMCK